MSHSFNPIGIVHSPFMEKFGIPRQGVLIPESTASIEFLPPYNHPDALRGIEAYSHLWILFIFHANRVKRFKPTVRPPRLGGNRRIGVFASRSGYRPNPIGLSLVEKDRVRCQSGKLYLDIKGVDLLNRTPVLDIKPYLPWSDRPDHPSAGFAEHPPSQELEVCFEPQAEELLASLPPNQGSRLRVLITRVLQNDPRPAIDSARYVKKEYGVYLCGWNVRWAAEENRMRVLALAPMELPLLTDRKAAAGMPATDGA